MKNKIETWRIVCQPAAHVLKKATEDENRGNSWKQYSKG